MDNEYKIKKCICGSHFKKKPSESYKDWNKRKYCSKKCYHRFHTDTIETKRKKGHSLEKHPLWKDNNIKKTPVLIKLLQRAGINTDICMICDKKIKYPHKHIHHKDKDRTNNKISNLMVVCVKCHMRLDGRGFYTDYAKAHNISQSTAWDRFNPEKKKEYYKRTEVKEKRREYYKKYYLNNKNKVKK